VEPAERGSGSGSGQSLWQRVGAGDHAAVTDLFHRHFEGSRSAAEDLAAPTFLTAWHRGREVRLVRDSARPWLLAVVTNLARKELRSRGRQERAVASLEVPAR
jgi:DNA-directed RNA polymerase specialized sigma24 family protein